VLGYILDISYPYIVTLKYNGDVSPAKCISLICCTPVVLLNISKELRNTSTELNTYVGVELLSVRGRRILRIEFRLAACSYAGGRPVECVVSHYTSCRASNQVCEYRSQYE
jgi:hypothetical protein